MVLLSQAEPCLACLTPNRAQRAVGIQAAFHRARWAVECCAQTSGNREPYLEETTLMSMLPLQGAKSKLFLPCLYPFVFHSQHQNVLLRHQDGG